MKNTLSEPQAAPLTRVGAFRHVAYAFSYDGSPWTLTWTLPEVPEDRLGLFKVRRLYMTAEDFRKTTEGTE